VSNLGRNSWDAQDDESPKAHAAFQAYLELGSNRTVAGVGKRLAKSRQLVDRWAQKYAWAQRAAAYDRHMATTLQTAKEAALVPLAADWAARQTALREAEWKMSEALLQQATTLLQLPAELLRPTYRDVAALADLASKLGRLASRMETDRKAVQGPNGEPLFDVDQMTDAELLAWIAGEKTDTPNE